MALILAVSLRRQGSVGADPASPRDVVVGSSRVRPATATPSRAPGPATAASAAGAVLVAVDARPWGRVVEIVDGDGNLVPLPADPVTPLAVRIPPGRWRVAVLGPDGRTLRRCALELTTASGAAPGRPRCAAFFARPDVRRFLERNR
jgi:hypothetical protein